MNPRYPIDTSNFTKAKYSSNEGFWNEELVLEPSMRKEKGEATGDYFICVNGKSYSSYKLSARNEDHSNLLSAGIAETSYIDHD